MSVTGNYNDRWRGLDNLQSGTPFGKKVEEQQFKDLWEMANVTLPKLLQDDSRSDDAIYNAMSKRKQFRQLKNEQTYCRKEYEEYKKHVKVLQSRLIWGANRADKCLIPSPPDSRYVDREAATFKALLSQPQLKTCDEPWDITLSPEDLHRVYHAFVVSMRAMKELGKKRVGPFYRVNHGPVQIWGHKMHPGLVFRLAPRDQVETELKKNQELRQFVRNHGLTFIKVPKCTSIPYQGAEQIYIETRVKGVILNINAFWSNLVVEYLKPDVNQDFKNHVREIVRQMACLVGKFPFAITGSNGGLVNFPYVDQDLNAIFATCIYSDSTSFGKKFTSDDRTNALKNLVTLFPLNSLLNAGVVKEFPDFPIPESLNERVQGQHKIYAFRQNWAELHIPLNAPAAAPAPQVLSPPAAASVETEILVRLPSPLAHGHMLSICGNGAGLDWDHRAPLFKIDERTFVYRFRGSPGDIEYKILCDGTWETGGNHRAEAGKKTEIVPNLSLPKPTTVITVNGGPSDNMTIRGQGIKALSWDKGQPMTYADGRWTFVTDEPCEIFEFKILKNGAWQQGDNGIAVFNEETEINPTF